MGYGLGLACAAEFRVVTERPLGLTVAKTRVHFVAQWLALNVL